MNLTNLNETKEAVISLGLKFEEKLLSEAKRFLSQPTAEKYYDWKKLYDIINTALSQNTPIIFDQMKLSSYYLQEMLNNTTLQRLINLTGKCKHCNTIFIVPHLLLLCHLNRNREFNNLCNECRYDKHETYRKKCQDCNQWHLRVEFVKLESAQ